MPLPHLPQPLPTKLPQQGIADNLCLSSQDLEKYFLLGFAYFIRGSYLIC